MRKERPAYLTITSLELPDSPIPLIDSQASARSRSGETSSHINIQRDEILDEFDGNITKVGVKDRKKVSRSAGCNNIKKNDCTRQIHTNSKECKSAHVSLVNCKRNNERIARKVIHNANDGATKDCICSEITENLRINIHEKTEVSPSSRSPSPEVTHTIRIAMKYLGQAMRNDEGVVGTTPTTTATSNDTESTELLHTNTINNGQSIINNENREFGCCAGVNVALDFTLNCNSVQLTSREINLKPVTTNNISID